MFLCTYIYTVPLIDEYKIDRFGIYNPFPFLINLIEFFRRYADFINVIFVILINLLPCDFETFLNILLDTINAVFI